MSVAEDKLDGSEPACFQSGHVIGGRYEVRGLLGQGGFGAVYLALHRDLHREVAVKVLLPQLVDNAEVVTRFVREARSAASIGHPGIVEVFDLGSDKDGVYLAMEKLQGEELHDRIERESPLPISFVAKVGMEIADAVHAAHEIGVIHRDLKPQNIFLAKQGNRGREIVKVLDFGIAKLIEADERSHVHLTRSGQVFGTPLYMSPEQLRGAKDLDVRADIYAMGTILYEALTGCPPFNGETFAELVLRISMETPPPLEEARPDIPPQLAAVVRKAMARDRDDRYPDAAALFDALEPFQTHRAQPPLRANSAAAFAETMDSERDLVSSPNPAPQQSTPESPPLLPGQPSRRLPLMLFAGGALVVGALSIVDMTEPSVDDEGPATSEVSQASEGPEVLSESEPPTAEVGDGPELGDDNAPELTGAAPPTTMRLVQLQSQPSGAMVLVEGAELCTTPCEEELDGSAELTFRRRGYRSAERSVGAEDSLVEVRLVPRPRRPASPMDHNAPPPILPLKTR